MVQLMIGDGKYNFPFPEIEVFTKFPLELISNVQVAIGNVVVWKRKLKL